VAVAQVDDPSERPGVDADRRLHPALEVSSSIFYDYVGLDTSALRKWVERGRIVELRRLPAKFGEALQDLASSRSSETTSR
jgi:hypothetical protein